MLLTRPLHFIQEARGLLVRFIRTTFPSPRTSCLGTVTTCTVGCWTSHSPLQTAQMSLPRAIKSFMKASSEASWPKDAQECKLQGPYLSDDRLTLSVFFRNTSIIDPWSRMISYHFLNQTSRANFFTNKSAHGAGQLWSQVPLTASWQKHLVPFPIIQADSRPVNSNVTTSINSASTVYEVNSAHRVE